ncbi:MAG: hypothetical protein JSU83_00400 [Deltaproteobacteria bacterium]|nr:MAG: hypothetical protein JSU83_00400 [Deltaproteobacteria bacterium]
MRWKFWQKNENNNRAAGPEIKKLSRPKDLPQEVGRHLVVEKNLDPDWVWSLKCTLRQQAGKKTTHDIRIFSQETAAQKGVSVMDYTSLDSHPELVLYEGYYDKQTREVHIESSMKKAV